MYTIIINSDNTLTQSIRERIMHRESNVHTFRFLVEPIWVDNGVSTNMKNYTCMLEYRTPISNTYTPVPLTPSEELYKEKLEYTLAIDTNLTAEVGDLEIKFIFTWLEMDADGNFISHSRKTDTTVVPIIKTDQWSDYVPDAKMDNIVQMLLMQQAQAQQLQEFANYLHMTKADTLSYNKETNELSIGTASQKLDSVILEDCDCENGIPVVDFNNIDSDMSQDTSQEMVNNVVEF